MSKVKSSRLHRGSSTKSGQRLNVPGGAGFSMIELIITIAMVSFGIVGIYSFFHEATLLASNGSLNITAGYLAQDAISVVDNIRANNILASVPWDQGLGACTLGCRLDYKTGTPVQTPANALQPAGDIFLKINADGLYSYDAGSASKFKRKVTITEPNADTLKVTALVTWNYNGKPHNYETIRYLYHWY